MSVTPATGATPLVVVLAAGEGRRMDSATPKPLHHLGGRTLLAHVLSALAVDVAQEIVVVVNPVTADQFAAAVAQELPSLPVRFVTQPTQRGTADAVAVALDAPTAQIADRDVLVVLGDTPMLRAESLRALLARHRESGASLTLLSARLENPSGYGRIVRDEAGVVVRIVEERDATDEQRAVDEVNSGVMALRGDRLVWALPRIGNDNAQGEYYLTDLVGLLRDAGDLVDAFTVDDPTEILGVNSPEQLAALEELLVTRRLNGAGSRPPTRRP